MDYIPVTQSFIFGPDLLLQQCVLIPTLSDSLLEQTEVFEVVATLNGLNIENSPLFGFILNSESKLFK